MRNLLSMSGVVVLAFGLAGVAATAEFRATGTENKARIDSALSVASRGFALQVTPVDNAPPAKGPGFTIHQPDWFKGFDAEWSDELACEIVEPRRLRCRPKEAP